MKTTPAPSRASYRHWIQTNVELVSAPLHQVTPSEAENPRWFEENQLKTTPYVNFPTASPGHYQRTSGVKPPACFGPRHLPSAQGRTRVGKDLPRSPWPTPTLPQPVPSAGTQVLMLPG